MDDESDKSMEPIEEVPLIRLGVRIREINHHHQAPSANYVTGVHCMKGSHLK